MAEMEEVAKVEPKENEKGLPADDPKKTLLPVLIDELGFSEEVKKDGDELKDKPVDEEEEENG